MLEERLRAVKEPGVPGVAVAIVDADGVRASAADGDADLASGTPASTDMVCPWFSMTKIVTATVAMRLHEHGVLDLDAPIASFVPAVGRMRRGIGVVVMGNVTRYDVDAIAALALDDVA